MGSESQNDVCAITAVVFNGAAKFPVSLRDDLMTAVGVFMNTDCIVYLYNETTLGIFFPHIPPSLAVKNRLTNMFKAVRESFRDAEESHIEALSTVRMAASTVFGFLKTFNFDVATLNAYEMALDHRSDQIREIADVVDNPLALRDLTASQQSVLEGHP